MCACVRACVCLIHEVSSEVLPRPRSYVSVCFYFCFCLFVCLYFRGEKYMGMWENDCRHGPGLLVTLDGIYNEGTFVQGKLSVRHLVAM